MNPKIFLAATALAATLIGSAAFADSHHGHKGKTGSNDQAGMMEGGSPEMMAMMKRMHGKMMDSNMMLKFDANGDGAVTPDEMRTQLKAKLTTYDKDGNGSLSIAEFETLHSAMIREMMVDKFQHLDGDGDGAITAQEMTAPADKMARMQKMRAKMEKMHGQEKGDGAMKMDN